MAWYLDLTLHSFLGSCLLGNVCSSVDLFLTAVCWDECYWLPFTEKEMEIYKYDTDTSLTVFGSLVPDPSRCLEMYVVHVSKQVRHQALIGNFQSSCSFPEYHFVWPLCSHFIFLGFIFPISSKRCWEERGVKSTEVRATVVMLGKLHSHFEPQFPLFEVRIITISTFWYCKD